jgi:hypothetical protein
MKTKTTWQETDWDRMTEAAKAVESGLDLRLATSLILDALEIVETWIAAESVRFRLRSLGRVEFIGQASEEFPTAQKTIALK